MTDRRGFLGGRPWLRPWLAVGIAAWITLGVVLVTRANQQGLVDDLSFSPYHLVGYAGLAVLGVVVAWAFVRALRQGSWRKAFPPLYGGLGLGFVLIAAWVILDPIWRATLGIAEDGIENGLAPTRLLIPAALVLLASGPLREAIALRAMRGLQPSERRIRWAGAVAAGLVGSGLTLAAFNPIQTPVSDWSYRPATDSSEVWTMAADGSGQTRLLAAHGDGTDYSLPAWSPDGSRIAYTAWTNDDGAPQNIGLDEQASAIWTMAADGTDRRLLVDGGDAQAWIPAWSPDGQWLTYTLTPTDPVAGSAAEPQPNAAPGQVGPPGAVAGSSIWIVRADGSGARKLSPDELDSLGATWSPDGASIAFVGAAGGGESDIYVAGLADGAITAHRALAGDRANDWGPAWSADGAEIAFVSNRSGNDEIWLIEAGRDGAAPRQLTDDPAGDWVPAFAPDGASIAFVSERSGEPEIWAMDTAGGNPRNLTNHPQHFDGTWSLSWSPDGTRLAYGNASFQDPVTSGWVREDFAAAEALLFALALAVVALLLMALGAPFGSFAVALGIVAFVAAVPVDGWRFLPGAVLGGLAVDVLVRAARPHWRARLAASGLAGLGTLAIGLTIGVGGTLVWSLTLLLGVALAAALLGWGLAEATERLFASRPEPALPAVAAPVAGV